jgi:hypothetical protein
MEESKAHLKAVLTAAEMETKRDILLVGAKVVMRED